MNIKRYLEIILIVVLFLFHRSVIVVLKSKSFDFKTTITATIGDVLCLAGDFFWHAFLKSGDILIKVGSLCGKNNNYNDFANQQLQ